VNASQNTTGTDFLSRNYDYYELYSMPERYLSRAASPVMYKQHGRKDTSVERRRVEGSGLSKVAEKVASRSSSPMPKPSNGGGIAHEHGQGHGGDGVLYSDLSVRANVSEKVRTATTAHAQARGKQVSPDRSVKADEGGKISRFSPPKPSSQSNNHAGSASFADAAMGNLSGTTDFSAMQISVHHVAKEAIRERSEQARQRREQALQDFNRRHFLSPETKEAK
jgi:hypothetical protein